MIMLLKQTVCAALFLQSVLVGSGTCAEKRTAPRKADVVTKKVYIDGKRGKIPVLISRKNDGKPRPAIIFLSGAPGTLRSCTKFVEGLPAKGFVGVTYEPRTRGERPVKIPKPYSIGRAILIEQIEPTARDITPVLDYLQKQPYVLPDKIGMGGHSAGGMTTILACTYDHRLAAGASVCSSGHFVDVSGRLNKPAAFLFHIAYGSKFGLKLSQVEKKTLQRIDPMARADKLHPVPFFFGAGSKDTLVLSRDVKSLYERALPYYKDAPERLVYKEMDCPHAGPKLEPLLQGAFAFLEKHLKQ